jgi:MinD-like ATPase involved in chromosome partitioning or flagellar assembly
MPPQAGLPLVAVMGLSNGVGATTLAVNLGLGLMQFGRSCVVDLHQQSGQVAVQLKMVPPRSTWMDLMSMTPGGDKRLIGGALMLDPRIGVAVLAAPLGATRDQLPAATMHYIFGVLSEGFKRIVLDVPTQLTDMSVAALQMASQVVLVVGDDPAGLTTAPSMIQSVADLRLPGAAHLVINRTRPHGVSHEEVMRTVNQLITADIPYEPGQVNALSEGKPLVMSRPDSLFSRAVLHLARQL